MDRGEFDAYVVAREDRLLSIAYLLTHDRALAEDLLQITLTKVWLARERIDAGSPDAYVRRVLVTTYTSWWRRRWTRELPAGDLVVEHDAAHADSSSAGLETRRVEARADLWRALGRLPRRQRAVVVLRYYEDLSEAEVADLMACSTGTVKSQASKALARLRVDPALADTPRDAEIRGEGADR